MWQFCTASRTTLLATALIAVQAQYFPAAPENVTVVQSRLESGVEIRFKQLDICETTPGVRSFSGYVTLPAGTLRDVGIDENFTINTFFYFAEARHNPATAPLALWFNGGPGSSSMIGAFQEHGPCRINADSNSTTLNPWSWNEAANMLYIDQPVQTGFSYDSLFNGTRDVATGDITLFDAQQAVPEQDLRSSLVGTFASQIEGNTVNTTQTAARAVWHFLQTWLQEFPEYKPPSNGINLWTESYGGHYGPAFATFFEDQNLNIANKSVGSNGDAHIINLDTLGIINGCGDFISENHAYVEMAANNTYGLQLYNQSLVDELLDQYYRPGTGCIATVQACQAAVAQGDPYNYGNNATVNEICTAINCPQGDVYFNELRRNPYDISGTSTDPFPPQYFIGWLNQHWVQQSFGVPLNYTVSNDAVSANFNEGTGDRARSGGSQSYLQDLARLLDSGTRVTLMYGDRDYICNWFCGQNISVNIPFQGQSAFQRAGYANLATNNSYNGGLVRQYGNLSFARVFEAGHEVPAYQPETALRIFQRTLQGLDVATGTVNVTTSNSAGSNGGTYVTSGPTDTLNFTNVLPSSPSSQCYIYNVPETCSSEQQAALMNAAAPVVNYILVDANTTAMTMPNGLTLGAIASRSSSSSTGTSTGSDDNSSDSSSSTSAGSDDSGGDDSDGDDGSGDSPLGFVNGTLPSNSSVGTNAGFNGSSSGLGSNSSGAGNGGGTSALLPGSNLTYFRAANGNAPSPSASPSAGVSSLSAGRVSVGSTAALGIVVFWAGLVLQGLF